jgi:hypothetical protein
MNTQQPQQEFFPGVFGLRWERDSRGAYVLVTEEGGTTVLGAIYKSFRDEWYVLRGGRPPHHSGSTGRVLVEKLDGEKLAGWLEVET